MVHCMQEVLGRGLQDVCLHTRQSYSLLNFKRLSVLHVVSYFLKNNMDLDSSLTQLKLGSNDLWGDASRCPVDMCRALAEAVKCIEQGEGVTSESYWGMLAQTP